MCLSRNLFISKISLVCWQEVTTFSYNSLIFVGLAVLFLFSFQILVICAFFLIFLVNVTKLLSTWLIFFFRQTPESFIGGHRAVGSWGRTLFTAQLVHWHCFLSPVASSHQAALVGWRRAQCAGPQMHHLPGRPVPQWLGPVAELFDW